MNMQKTDYSNYILPVGLLVLGYVVLRRFGIIKDERAETEQLFKNYFSPNYLRSLYSTPGRIQLFTQADAENVARQIYRAKGIFNDDETALYAAIKRFRFKSQISQVAEKFFRLYNKDLAFFLADFLNETELNRIYSFTDNLPTGKI